MKRTGISYRTAQMANQYIDKLPSGPKWKVKTIKPENGYETAEPVVLFKRDAVECVQYLLNNPLFADHISFIPVKHFAINGDRVFREPISGFKAWRDQVRTCWNLVSVDTLNFSVAGCSSPGRNAFGHHIGIRWYASNKRNWRFGGSPSYALFGQYRFLRSSKFFEPRLSLIGIAT